MNVLFTSAGRRGYLLEWFVQSGNFNKVVALNSESCVAFSHADFWEIAPLTVSEKFEDFILQIVKKYDIGLVIPLTDLDAFVISRFQSELNAQGVTFFGPNTDAIKLMLDKGVWPGVLKDLGFPTPKTFFSLKTVESAINEGIASFPLIIKPRVGTSSQFQQVIWELNELKMQSKRLGEGTPPSFLDNELAFAIDERYIFQEFAVGTEYGIDLLVDFSGNFEGYLGRRKLSMRAGETDTAFTLKELSVNFSLSHLAKSIGAIGLVDIDLIIKPSGESMILDLNPRVGGGYPFSHVSGADLPKFVHEWLSGGRIKFDYSLIREIMVGKVMSVIEIPT